MTWQKTVEGRTIEGLSYSGCVTIDVDGIWMEVTIDFGNGDEETSNACFTVDMARNLRAALDEAIERASAGG